MPGLPFQITGSGGAAVAGALNSIALLDQHMTPFDVKRLRDQLGDKLVELGKEKSIGSGPGSLTVRDVGYNRDIGGAADTWVSAAATVANAWYTFVNVALAANKAVCVYGFWSRDAAPNVERVRCQAAGGGSTFADIDVSGIYSSLQQVCYFSTPVFYNPTDTIFVQLWTRLAAVTISGLLALVVEPQGIYLTKNIA